ncbi:MAG: nucleotide sugar dehydrogenase [Nitrospinales bacterium]
MLIEKIKQKKARIGVIGLGYVGLPLMLEFGKAGFPVAGLDLDPEKIARLSRGQSYIRHIPDEAIRPLVESGRLELGTEFAAVSGWDCILICVPTPLNRNRSPNLTYIVSTARQVSPYLAKGQLVVLESTTYPGTTQEVLAPELESASGLQAGRDFFVAYSPEREDPNNKQYATATIPKVVGADSAQELAVADALYRSIVKKTVPVSDTRTAEATKLMENIFRSVNIALVNEMKIILDAMGIDVWEVVAAAATKPFGYMPFYPGPGLGGHCIPIDPFYLAWKAREYDIPTRFIELAGEINVSMPEYVFRKILTGLNRAGKSLNGSRILILGVAYKKDVDDDRESVSFKIMDMLTCFGACVEYNDPYVPEIGAKRDYPRFVGKKQVPLDDLSDFDLTVILTDHSRYDYEKIVADSKIVVDTRNACRNINSDKIIKA